MKYTEKLKLKKPDYTDPIDIKDLNENFEIIDQLKFGPGGVHVGVAEPTDEDANFWVDTSEKDMPVGTVLWSGTAYVTSNSAVASLGEAIDTEAYTYYEVTIEYGGYALDKTNVRCYPCKVLGTQYGGSAICGHLTWYAGYWLSLDIMIYRDGTARLGCLFRSNQDSNYTVGSNTFTISQITGYTR